MEYEYAITSALLIGEWLKNIAQSISQRQQARCTQKLFILADWS